MRIVAVWGRGEGRRASVFLPFPFLTSRVAGLGSESDIHIACRRAPFLRISYGIQASDTYVSCSSKVKSKIRTLRGLPVVCVPSINALCGRTSCTLPHALGNIYTYIIQRAKTSPHSSQGTGTAHRSLGAWGGAVWRLEGWFLPTPPRPRASDSSSPSSTRPAAAALAPSGGAARSSLR